MAGLTAFLKDLGENLPPCLSQGLEAALACGALPLSKLASHWPDLAPVVVCPSLIFDPDSLLLVRILVITLCLPGKSRIISLF